MNSLRKKHYIQNLYRFHSSKPEFVNRNPRNLERMGIAHKPDGYHLDKPGRKYWHRLAVTVGSRSVTAEVVHYMNGPVVQATTSEWALRSQLYSTKDTSAFIALGKVFAQRCLECGITEMFCNLQVDKSSKLQKFVNEIVKGGILLEEMEAYKEPIPSNGPRPEKPWEVIEK